MDDLDLDAPGARTLRSELEAAGATEFQARALVRVLLWARRGIPLARVLNPEERGPLINAVYAMGRLRWTPANLDRWIARVRELLG